MRPRPASWQAYLHKEYWYTLPTMAHKQYRSALLSIPHLTLPKRHHQPTYCKSHSYCNEEPPHGPHCPARSLWACPWCLRCKEYREGLLLSQWLLQRVEPGPSTAASHDHALLGGMPLIVVVVISPHFALDAGLTAKPHLTMVCRQWPWPLQYHRTH